ncbi:hypothetical protein [Streptomyces sp. NBC_01565]|nr:hypothetical protein [Streptomyces sp. NBC_01565]MCX4546976.1 hypothetical protein [Streptomyces sp. NBC_01565]
MLKRIVIASLLTATAAMGAATPAMAANPAPAIIHGAAPAADVPSDEPAAPRAGNGRRCSYGLLFNDNRLTCDYAL